jgi:uncharacterized protein (DUF952 family)
MDHIAHICTLENWQNAKSMGAYRADSLKTEGFIHCSRPTQVLEVANRYYLGQTDLILLWIDPSQLKTELRWETSAGDQYPHVYGSIDLEAIDKVTRFLPESDGTFRTLPEF